jgi:hypothetical protein
MYHKFLVFALLAVLIGCTALPALTAASPQTAFPGNGFGVLVAADQHTYIRPIIKMRLTVFNYTPAPVTFNFKTSKRYDFTIYNSRGLKVWQWSDGQPFLDVIGKLTLKPNDTVTYTAEYQSKIMLTEDVYTLKGELTAFDMRLRKPRVMEGTVSFWAILTK